MPFNHVRSPFMHVLFETLFYSLETVFKVWARSANSGRDSQTASRQRSTHNMVTQIEIQHRGNFTFFIYAVKKSRNLQVL